MKYPDTTAFVPHYHITNRLAAGWDMHIVDETTDTAYSVGENLVLDVDEPLRQVWRGHHWLDTARTCWVKVVIEIRSMNPDVQFWFLPGYGSKATGKPIIQSHELNVVWREGVLMTLDTEGIATLHGQCRAMQSLTVGFQFETVTLHTVVTAATKYLPRDATQTGGHWPYMGIQFDVENIALAELYPVMAYPGWMVLGDDDGTIMPNDREVVLHGGSHYHPDAHDRGHIAYTHATDTWKDRSREPLRYGPDDQHYSIYGTIAQKYLATKDEGLRLILEFIASQMLQQIPATDRGTTHHKPGQARAQGRTLKDATEVYVALLATPNRALADTVGLHAYRIWEGQADRWFAKAADGQQPWPWFEGAHWSPAEVGIWYWGLHVFRAVAGGLGVDLPRLEVMLAGCAKFCFDAFTYYPQSSGWAVPYYINPDGTQSEGPSGGSHFAWLAATSHEPTTGELTKHAAILAMGDSLDQRWRGIE